MERQTVSVRRSPTYERDVSMRASVRIRATAFEIFFIFVPPFISFTMIPS